LLWQRFAKKITATGLIRTPVMIRDL
jgi:hypothetical protein